MKRYHTEPGTGTGIDEGLMHEAYGCGSWVLYEDAQLEMDKAYQRGLNAGHLNRESVPPEFSPKADDTRTNQLLNELYHDRARLERQVQKACELMDKVREYAEEYNWVDDRDESIDNDYPLIGSLEQFADSHRE